MPKDSLSVYLTAVDKMSPVLASITDKTKALDKESQELQQTFDALQKANKGLIERKTELQKKLQDVNEEVKEARKSFKELGDEASSDAYEKAQQKQQKLRNEIAATTKSLQENQKIYKENIETIRKGGMDEQGTSLKDMAKGIFAGQIGQMFSASIGGALEYGLTSAIGTPEASLISDTLSSAIAGGAAGAMFGHAGIAAGTILGGVSGMIAGGTKIFEAQDDAFKNYYGGLYQDVSGRSGEMVGAGTTLASTRETNRISFKTLFGSEEAATQYLDKLTDMANRTPFLYDDLVSMSKTLATYGYNEKNILPLLQTVGDAGAALGMGTGDMNAVAQALGRMKSSDKATLEYLNMLNDRGIGAVGMLAEAKGVSQGDMYKMISDGGISGSEAVEIITAALKEAYSGSMAEQSQTFSGLSSTLEGLQQNLDALGGEGYNALRKEGVQEEVNALGGALGEAIGEINRVMGENQARKENMQEEYTRQALEAVLLGQEGSAFNEEQNAALSELAAEFATWSAKYEESGGTDAEAAAHMESLYEEAQTLGQAYFENSDFVKMLNDTELDEIQTIRDATAGLDNATQATYKLQQELSKGLVATIKINPGTVGISASGGTWDTDPNALSGSGGGGNGWYDDGGNFHPHAFGLDRVPYDDYPALLHEGERVLTAAQARAQDAGQAGAAPIQIIVTGNSFTGTPEEMADQLAEILARKIAQANTAAAPR